MYGLAETAYMFNCFHICNSSVAILTHDRMRLNNSFPVIDPFGAIIWQTYPALQRSVHSTSLPARLPMVVMMTVIMAMIWFNIKPHDSLYLDARSISRSYSTPYHI